MVILSGPVKAEVCQAPAGKNIPARHSKAAIIAKCGGGAHLGFRAASGKRQATSYKLKAKSYKQEPMRGMAAFS
ncbi:hypothetical protein [Pseudomonas juntendi]|uniref:hypothetical protein n=1 Tax=Pseudomonas juntendi TaxID=2666183 RepID=UPI00244C268E|nr:hypothetical protein [Pseudomonas juntendi]MDH1552327.1 hypothetical protein [Pseudomonas juntendi]